MADPAPGISAVPHEDNLRYFDVAITGPEGSPFERESSPVRWRFHPIEQCSFRLKVGSLSLNSFYQKSTP